MEYAPAGQRADRDFRKQTIMTIRTLLLEVALLERDPAKLHPLILEPEARCDSRRRRG